MRIKIALLLFFLVSAQIVSWAQNEADYSAFLQANNKDVSGLIQDYAAPMVKAFSYGMTGSWFNTAQNHKKLGFDFGVSLNMVFMPTSDNYFTPRLSSGTTFTNNTNPTLNAAPTIIGPKDVTTYAATYDAGGSLGTQTANINGPEGLDLKGNLGFAAVPVPMAQIGIGLIKNTDLKIRFVPNLSKGSSNIQMFGVGLMHDVKQYIPGVKALPFDLSVLVAYNSLSGSTSLVNTNPADQRPDSNDGSTSYKFNSWVFQALISKKISVITFYGGFGFSTISTKVNLTGSYKIDFISGQSKTLTNPVSMDISNSTARATVGVRFKFGPVFLNSDYTFQKYDTWSAGFGFSIR